MALACTQGSDVTETRLLKEMRATGQKIESSHADEHAESFLRAATQVLADLETIQQLADWERFESTDNERYWDLVSSMGHLNDASYELVDNIAAWRQSPYSLEATWVLNFALESVCRRKTTIDQLIDFCPGVTEESLTQIGKHPDLCTTSGRRHFHHLLYLISWYDAEGIPSNPGKSTP